MGDRPPLLPLSDAVKTKIDAGAAATAGLAWFQAIPWSDIAAFLTCVWILLRIAEWAWFKFKRD